jgi:hypothetical protein
LSVHFHRYQIPQKSLRTQVAQKKWKIIKDPVTTSAQQ